MVDMLTPNACYLIQACPSVTTWLLHVSRKLKHNALTQAELTMWWPSRLPMRLLHTSARKLRRFRWIDLDPFSELTHFAMEMRETAINNLFNPQPPEVIKLPPKMQVFCSVLLSMFPTKALFHKGSILTVLNLRSSLFDFKGPFPLTLEVFSRHTATQYHENGLFELLEPLHNLRVLNLGGVTENRGFKAPQSL